MLAFDKHLGIPSDVQYCVKEGQTYPKRSDRNNKSITFGSVNEPITFGSKTKRRRSSTSTRSSSRQSLTTHRAPSAASTVPTAGTSEGTRIAPAGDAPEEFFANSGEQISEHPLSWGQHGATKIEAKRRRRSRQRGDDRQRTGRLPRLQRFLPAWSH